MRGGLSVGIGPLSTTIDVKGITQKLVTDLIKSQPKVKEIATKIVDNLTPANRPSKLIEQFSDGQKDKPSFSNSTVQAAFKEALDGLAGGLASQGLGYRKRRSHKKKAHKKKAHKRR